jgi:ABC-type Fe3+ transport system substrate-binding protein
LVSGFGFIYNYERLASLGLPIPVTWDDLADYQYFGEIISTNPATSGSSNANFLQMLQFKTSQHAGSTIDNSTDSTEAWEFWNKVAGNIGEWPSSSSATPNSVADGSYSIGLTIDFFAFSRRETFPVGFSYGGATAVSPDPVAIITNAPNQVPAERFMDYITSARGQSRVGKFRTPVNINATAVYPIQRAFNWDGSLTGAFPAIDPYDQALYDLVYDETRALVNNWFVQNAVAQRAAWQAINTAQNATAKTQALATYLTLPTGFNGTLISLEELNHTDTSVTAGWLADGAANFALAKTQAEAPADPIAPTVTTITLPGGQTTVSTVSVSTTTQSAVSGFLIFVIIPSVAGMVLLRRYKKKH